MPLCLDTGWGTERGLGAAWWGRAPVLESHPCRLCGPKAGRSLGASVSPTAQWGTYCSHPKGCVRLRHSVCACVCVRVQRLGLLYLCPIRGLQAASRWPAPRLLMETHCAPCLRLPPLP